jgi:hypothetical protein
VESWGIIAFNAGLGILADTHWVACPVGRALADLEKHEEELQVQRGTGSLSIHTTNNDRHEDTIFTKRS